MDFIKEIFKFFIDKNYSITSKFVGIVIPILILFFIDNLLGFSFYYSNNQKITQLMNIEKLKNECYDNSYVLESLNETEKAILERKNVISLFLELFSKENLDVKKQEPQIRIDTAYIERADTVVIRDATINANFQQSENSIKNNETVVVSRSRLWHTLTSSYFFIFLLIILPIVPFTEKSFSWSTMIGMLLVMIIVAGLIWLNQFLLGLIPIIFKRVWINYVINILIQGIVFTIAIVWFNEKPKE